LSPSERLRIRGSDKRTMNASGAGNPNANHIYRKFVKRASRILSIPYKRANTRVYTGRTSGKHLRRAEKRPRVRMTEHSPAEPRLQNEERTNEYPTG
jgi:hypothetical protein